MHWGICAGAAWHHALQICCGYMFCVYALSSEYICVGDMLIVVVGVSKSDRLYILSNDCMCVSFLFFSRSCYLLTNGFVSICCILRCTYGTYLEGVLVTHIQCLHCLSVARNSWQYAIHRASSCVYRQGRNPYI